MAFTAAHRILADSIARRVFPGAAIEVGRARAVRWRDTIGHLTYDPDAPATAAETVFDLSSLTKVIATTTAAMQLAETGRLHLQDHVARWLPQWVGRDRADVTVEDLLSHSSGLPGWLPLFRQHRGRQQFLTAIATTALVYAPHGGSLYSDLGFMLLGFILEDAAQEPLDRQFEAIRSRLGLGDITFRPPAAWRSRIAPTKLDPLRGGLLIGDVHDDNAAALDGVAGHAGLFGTVSAIGEFARLMLLARIGERGACERLASPETVRRFTTRGNVPASSRALGWDTMLPTSSCGTRMSPAAFGHTGWSGTSLWIDPERDLYAVLLSNCVHPSRENDLIQEVRRAFHDAVVEGVDW